MTNLGTGRVTAEVVDHLDGRLAELWRLGARRPEDDPSWVYWMPQPSLTAEPARRCLPSATLLPPSGA
jgi:hypothetical protein